MYLDKIASVINAQNKNVPPVQINWLLTDSRSLSFPSETLFFAICTARNDGHNYIEELYRQNVRCFVVSEMRAKFKSLKDATFLLVDNTLDALHTLAIHHRAQFNIPVIGITGSNGKTVVKEWLYQVLHNDFRIVRSPRSYNSQIGVPLSVWALSEGTQLGVFEAGISKPHEMERLQPVIRPTVGLFTNLGDAHQESFTNLKQKCEEKLLLFKNADILIYCSDNELIKSCIADAGLKAELFSWGKSKDAKLQVISAIKANFKTRLKLKYNKTETELTVPYADDASIENALHCIAVLLYFKFDFTEISKRISLLEPVAMRLEVKEGVHNCIVINDSYNSDLNSLGIALDFLNQQATVKNLSRTVILSDVLETGLPSNELYSVVGKLLKEKNIQHVIGIGHEISNYSEELDVEQKDFFATTDDFLKSKLIRSFRDAVILLKGSRKFRFEEISQQLEAIAHETILEVNLNALVDNLNYFRSKLHPTTKVICMVKAFAYGSGSVEVAHILQHHHADYLAVAVADEGAELRQEGIRLPIIVMNPEKGSFNEIFDNALEPEIYSFGLLNSFITAAEKLGVTDYPIHVKIDSGMHRLGFEQKEITELIELLKNQNRVKVRSVFSHLAGADESRFDDFTEQQVSIFTTCAGEISNAFSHNILRHILNSSGIERFPQYQFDMVRLGIGHYGISALKDVKLATVCTLKTIILQIKTIKAGETVGYSRKGVLTKDTRIAILPVGYADGFDRRLGSGVGEVLINGQRAKTVGNICMDLCMVDVTDIPANEGDTVEVFGENITITEVANKTGTISYEILTGISRRVKRIYYQE